MRVIIQRCKSASVHVADLMIGSIGLGMVVLVGFTHDDTEEDVKYMVDKVAGLRIFEDPAGKMNVSIEEVGGAILSISQFTLYGDARKGRRPNFMAAAKPEQANELYERFNSLLRETGIAVQTGKFGEMMDVSLVNWGPVTIALDSQK
jgi:D-tyrosyl-tRNA(Tyr) deacylase